MSYNNETIGKLLVEFAEDSCKRLNKFSDDLATVESRTTGWLIERGGQWYAAAPHTSWTVRQALYPVDQENWTADATKALRFARQVDAETLIRFVGWQNATATEHMFLNATGGGDGR